MSYIINFQDSSGNEGTLKPDGGFSYTDKLNEVNEGNFIFSGSGELKRSLIAVGSTVKVYRNSTLEFHGLVDDIEFYDGGAMAVHASGYEIWLAKENGAYASSPWSATASATIFNSVIGESNYLTAGTVDAGTSIDFRSNVSSSLFNTLRNLSEKTAQDIGIDYANSEVDILDHKGSATSVETLNAGIQIADVAITQSYPISNKVKVYGQSEGSTRVESDTAQGQDATSQTAYGIIAHIIEDRTITTVAEANLLANAEVARLKDPRKIYNFNVLNPTKTWVSGDVITINAKSQGVSAEEVRIVQLKRGISGDKEFLECEVTNKEFSKLTKTRDEIVAELDKKSRDSTSYDTFQEEYSNQTTTTYCGGVAFSSTFFVDFNDYFAYDFLWIYSEGFSLNNDITADDFGSFYNSSTEVIINSLQTKDIRLDSAGQVVLDPVGTVEALGQLNMNGNDIQEVLDLVTTDDIWCGDRLYVGDTWDYYFDVVSDILNLSGNGTDFYIGPDVTCINDLTVLGTKNCVITTKKGKNYLFSAIESPEIWFEEKMSGEIKKGICEIKLDQRFIDCTLVNKKHPLNVLITPTSDYSKIWIEKYFDKIIVHGDAKTFDCVISAKRIDKADVRFTERKRSPKDIKKLIEEKTMLHNKKIEKRKNTVKVKRDEVALKKERVKRMKEIKDNKKKKYEKFKEAIKKHPNTKRISKDVSKYD